MIKQKKTLRLILFAHLLCVGQVRTQSLTDYLFRPASTIFNSLTGGFTTTAQPGQISNRDGIVTQSPGNSQSQQFVRQPQSQRQQFVQPQQQQYVQSQGFSPNQQFVNSYQPAQSCANSLAYQRDNNGNTQGYLSIRNPSRSRNVLKVTLIVAAQLSVSHFEYFYVILTFLVHRHIMGPLTLLRTRTAQQMISTTASHYRFVSIFRHKIPFQSLFLRLSTISSCAHLLKMAAFKRR